MKRVPILRTAALLLSVLISLPAGIPTAAAEIPERAALSANLLQNPGFEDVENSSWTAQSGTLFITVRESEYVTVNSHEGKAIATVGGTTTPPRVYQTVTIPETGTYELSGYVFRGGNYTSIEDNLVLQANNRECFFTYETLDQWQKISMRFPAEKGSVQKIAFGTREAGESSLLSWDDFSLTLVSSSENGPVTDITEDELREFLQQFELIRNPGFEDGKTDWALNGLAFMQPVQNTDGNTYPIRSGKTSLNIGTLNDESGITQSVVVPCDGVYELSVDVCRLNLSTSSNYFVLLANGQKAVVPYDTAGEWKTISLRFMALKGSTVELSIGCGVSSSIQNNFIDNASLDWVDNLSFATPPPAAPDHYGLVLDGGFEKELTQSPWKEVGFSGTVIGRASAYEHVHSGKQSCVILTAGSNRTDNILTQEVRIPQKGTYLCTAYVQYTPKQPDAKPATLELGGTIHTIYNTQGKWQKITATLTTTQDNALSQIVITKPASPDLLYIDDVSIADINDPPPDSPNLLENNSFEDGLNGWTNQGDLCAFSSDAQIRTGKRSAYMAYFTSEGLRNYIEQTVSARPGETYTLSAYLKTTDTLSGAGAILTLDARDASGRVLDSVSSQTLSDSGGAWKRLSVKMQVPEGTAQITAKIGGVYCKGAFYVDDAALIRSM